MSLNLNVKYLQGLTGHHERLVRASFRGFDRTGQAVRGRDVVYMGETLQWPVGRRITERDYVDIAVYNCNKILQDKLVGKVRICLQALAEADTLSFDENLLDDNNCLCKATISFDINYSSPDALVGDLRMQDFDFPRIDVVPKKKKRKSEEGSDDDDLDDPVREMDRDSAHSSEDTESIPSIPPRKTLGMPSTLPPTLYELEEFSISVTIIKAEKLVGNNINPIVEVLLDEEIQRTEIKRSTNSPYYNQFMCFDVSATRAQLMEQTIIIRVRTKGNHIIKQTLFAGDIIGEFRLGVATIYEQPDHTINEKWAVLVDPRDVMNGVRGYVKTIITVFARGDKNKLKQTATTEDVEDIEGNLLLPLNHRQMVDTAEIAVKLYKAADLPNMNTDIMSSIKEAMQVTPKPLVDPFVRVSFAGYSEQTKRKNSTANPEWNQQVQFTVNFPPLCSRIRIAIYDHDYVKNERISTTFIDLKDIMNSEIDGFLPTFGPAWISLYGNSRSFKYEQVVHDDELNKSLGEGSFYRGKILVAIQTQLKSNVIGLKLGPKVRSINRLPEAYESKPTDFLLFGSVFTASVIHKKIGKKGKPIHFEVSIGNIGNTIDGDILTKFRDDKANDPSDPLKPLPMWCQSTTPPLSPITPDSEYYFIPYNERKPCVYMRCRFVDQLHRLYACNILDRTRDILDAGINRVEAIVAKGNKGGHRHLRVVLGELSEAADKASVAVRASRAASTKTLLDKYRLRLRYNTLEKIKKFAMEEKDNCTAANRDLRINQLKQILDRITALIEEPQDCMPDIFVYMMCGQERIGYSRVPVRSIISSQTEEQCGKAYGKISTFFMQRPGKLGVGSEGRELPCQFKIFLWLGKLKNMAMIKELLPSGYNIQCFSGRRPPDEVEYMEKSYFQFRAHMYMARNLVAADDSGLSDPFARVIINNSVVTTEIIETTLNPIWDQTLIVDVITFYHCETDIAENAPIAVIEVFDADDDGTYEFIGRCFCKPVVTLLGDQYTPSRLDWWEIYRNQEFSGDLLASFELLQVDEADNFQLPAHIFDTASQCDTLDGRSLLSGTVMTEDMPVAGSLLTPLIEHPEQAPLLDDTIEDEDDANKKNALPNMKTMLGGIGRLVDKVRPKKKKGTSSSIVSSRKSISHMRVPDGIRPETALYRMELLLWGVRNLKSLSFFTEPDQPQLTIEFGGHKVMSKIIEEASVNPNFSDSLSKLDILLPHNLWHWPPVTIICMNNAPFGVETLIGTNVISSLTDFIWWPEIPDELSVDNEIDEVAETKSFKSRASSVFSTMLSKKSSSLLHGMKGRNGGAAKSHKTYSAVSGHSNKGCDEVDKAGSGVGADGVIVDIEGGEEDDGIQAPSVHIDEEITEVTRYKKRIVVSKQDLDEVDWWTRYFVSMTAPTTVKPKKKKKRSPKEKIEAIEEEEEIIEVIEEVDEADRDILKDIEIEAMDEGDDKDVMEIVEEEDEKEAKRQKKLRKKKDRKRRKRARRKALRKFILGDEEERFTKEGKADDAEVLLKNKKMDWVEKITVLPCALEDCEEYHGFSKLLKTYPIYRGKKEDFDNDEDRTVGSVKLNFLLYEIDPSEYNQPLPICDMRLNNLLPSPEPEEVVVRLYVIRGVALHPHDSNGKSDPYLIVEMGEQIMNDKDKYIPKTLNPTFGRMFEFKVIIPLVTDLKIKVMDWDMLSFDYVVGETSVDIESRMFAVYRATCGLARQYDPDGYNAWRDQQLPSVILEELCKDHDVDLPHYEPMFNKITVNGSDFYADTEIVNSMGDKIASSEPLALAALHNFHKIVPGIKLVPEHIESRALYQKEKPGIEQGRLEMWIDIFPKHLGPPSAARDISPRVSISYELRVIVWNVSNVILSDVALFGGEKSSDIYVKGWLKDMGIDDQKTDVHYRSLDGDGNFNWRFIFPFDYLKAEDKIVYKIKDSVIAIDEMEKKEPCRLTMQVWDADLITSDDFLGGFEFPLSAIPRGARTPKSCGIHQLKTDGSVPTFSLFRNKRYKAWWPFAGDEDSQDSDTALECTGKVELQLELLTTEEASNNPAGLERKEPLPLPDPKRPDFNMFSFLNPLKALKYLICHVLFWILIKLMILALILLIFFLFIYSTPGQISRKMVGT